MNEKVSRSQILKSYINGNVESNMPAARGRVGTSLIQLTAGARLSFLKNSCSRNQKATAIAA